MEMLWIVLYLPNGSWADIWNSLMGMFSVGKEIACETVLITDANPAGKCGRSWERHIQIVSFYPSNVPVTKGVEQLLLLLITVRIIILRLLMGKPEQDSVCVCVCVCVSVCVCVFKPGM